LWDYVDKDFVKGDLIKGMVDGAFIDDNIFSIKDYSDYIKENITIFLPEIDKFIKKHHLLNTKYEMVLKLMKKIDFIKLITKYEKSNDFLEYYYNDRWDVFDAEEILFEIWGKHNVLNDLYPYIRQYIKDEEKIINDFHDTIEFSEKFEYVRDNISYDRKLQEKLLIINPNTVVALFDIIDTSLGNDYHFQKKYLEFMFNENNVKPDDIYPHELKKLNVAFGLNPKIEEEYKDYLYGIDSEKYNL
jgi:hypothetical protein